MSSFPSCDTAGSDLTPIQSQTEGVQNGGSFMNLYIAMTNEGLRCCLSAQGSKGGVARRMPYRDC